MKLLAILAALLATATVLRSAETPAPSPAADQRAANQPPKVELKRVSTFASDSVTRNPFWPIGFKPVAKVTSSGIDHTGPEIPVTAFSVTSIALDSGARFAIINGKAMSEGQQFGLKYGSQIYQITVKAIQDGQVILARRDQEIAVPLRRK